MTTKRISKKEKVVVGAVVLLLIVGGGIGWSYMAKKEAERNPQSGLQDECCF